MCIAPPPPPVVYSTNTSVCFWSRSPVESYLVTVTDVSGTNTSLSGTYNTSQCLPITADLSPDVCISVITVNRVGISNITVHQINTDSLPCFQLRGLLNTVLNKQYLHNYHRCIILLLYTYTVISISVSVR